MITMLRAGDVLVASGTSPAGRLQYPDYRPCAFSQSTRMRPNGACRVHRSVLELIQIDTHRLNQRIQAG